MILLTDEEIQEATDKHAPVWEVDGGQLSKVEILQRQHARLRAPAKAQLKKGLLSIESKFRREVIPSGSQAYTQEEIELLGRLNSAYYMISKEDWRALLEEIK